jgi:hypothetical protein
MVGAATVFPADPLAFFAAHIRPSGRPWSFAGHEYLRGIMSDPAVHRVIQKGAQLGLSTLSIGELLRWCAAGRKIGYYLSDRDFMTAFVQDRVDTIINADPDLARATLEGKAFEHVETADRSRRKSADNLRIKHLGQGSMWFMGLQKRKDVKSLDLDAYILDEVDEVDQDLAVWLGDRLLHSTFKRVIELSQPSVPDWGIAERYAASDQKVWLHRCPRCRSWHCLEDEWPDNFRVPKRGTGPELLCLKCDARLISPRVKCEWVARRPDCEISGYRLSQLYGPAMTARELQQKWAACARSRSKLENFTISILGLPFPGDRQPLSESVLKTACGDWPLGVPGYVSALAVPRGETGPLIVAGIDQGDLLHLLIGVYYRELLAVVWAEVIEDDWDLLGKRLADHGVQFFVIDALPNKSNAKKLLRSGLNGAMSYLNATAMVVKWEEQDTAQPLRVVVDDRTTAIDEMADEVAAGLTRLPSPRLDVTQLVKRHCKALVKDFDPQTGKMTYKRGVANHFGMALASLRQAKEIALQLGLGPRGPLNLETATFGSPIEPQIW